MSRAPSILSVAVIGLALPLGSACTVVVHSAGSAPHSVADGHCYSCAEGPCRPPPPPVVARYPGPPPPMRTAATHSAPREPGHRRVAAPRMAPQPPTPAPRRPPAAGSTPPPPRPVTADPTPPRRGDGAVATDKKPQPATDRERLPPETKRPRADPEDHKTPQPRKTPAPVVRRDTGPQEQKSGVDSPTETDKKRMEPRRGKLSRR